MGVAVLVVIGLVVIHASTKERAGRPERWDRGKEAVGTPAPPFGGPAITPPTGKSYGKIASDLRVKLRDAKDRDEAEEVAEICDALLNNMLDMGEKHENNPAADELKKIINEAKAKQKVLPP